MQIAAFAVGCMAAVLASMSLAWQVYSWRAERRFAVAVVLREEPVPIGHGRYPVRVVATNEGGTTEWVEQVALKVVYDRELNSSMIFFSPELVRNPSMNRQLPPRNRFESEFNLLAAVIAAGGLPVGVAATVTFASGREVRSGTLRPDPDWAAGARESDDPVADVNSVVAEIEKKLPGGIMGDYYPAGPFALCDDCKAEIPVDARVCRYCGFRIEPPPAARGDRVD